VKDQPFANQQFTLNYDYESEKQFLFVQTDAEGYFDLDDTLNEQFFDVTTIVNRKIWTSSVCLIKTHHGGILKVLDKQNTLAIQHPLVKSGMFGEKKMKQDDPPKLKEFVDVIECAKRGMYDALLELIEKHQADVNEQNENGDYAVVCVAQRNDLRMIKMLVEHGARLDIQDGSGRTPLGYAKKYNNAELITFITDNLARNNCQPAGGMELQ
jgi:ankyrin repeat protein